MKSNPFRIFLFLIFFPLVCSAQEIPEALVPDHRVTYGTNNHTSRDAIFFSEMDSRGNLIVAGYTEQDFTFSDVKIFSHDQNLNVNWSDQLSWDGISYDYPMDLLIDDKDHIWIISKNYMGGSAAIYSVIRYSPTGQKLWEYQSPTPLETSTLNMKQYYYFFDSEGFLNLSYQKAQQMDAKRTLFRISPSGVATAEYEVEGPLNMLTDYKDSYLGLSLRYDTITYDEPLYSLRFNERETREKLLDLEEDQVDKVKNSLFERNSISFADGDGNYIYVGGGDFFNHTGSRHPGIVMLSVDQSNEIKFFKDDDQETDKYLLDARVSPQNEILVLANTQPTGNQGEPILSLEKYSTGGDLLSTRTATGITGNMGKLYENRILVRSLSGQLQIYDAELNLLQETTETTTETYFHPQDIHSINESIYLVGTTIAAKYEGSDYNSEENFYIRKFGTGGLEAEFHYNGEGTSKFYNYHMVKEDSGDILVSCREFYGPNNLNLGGSKAPYDKKVIRFNSNLEYKDEEIVDENFHLWKDPGLKFTASNGDEYRYEIDDERESVTCYLNGNQAWIRQLDFDNDNFMEVGYNNRIDKEGNLILSSSLYRNFNGMIHKLTPDNEYSRVITGGSLMNQVILSNNWIFSIYEDYSIRIYSPELELINEVQYDQNFFYSENYPYLVEKNNKVLLNVTHEELVMVFDQFGNYEDQFRIQGLLHPSVSFFDENDALNVYHLVGKGIYTEHGHNWSRLAISRYDHIVEDYIGYANGDGDQDGVPDSLDRCPDSEPGAEVDANGCKLLELPADNFTFSTKDETCPGRNNGQFVINVKEEHDYVVNLNGEEHYFPLGISFEALSPGTYMACVQVVGQPHTMRCVEFEIKAGESLKAVESIEDNKMNISIKEGTGPYEVTVNGQQAGLFHVENFKIPVKDGDLVEVKSANECEGNLNLIAVINSVRLHSNPVTDIARVLIPSTIKRTVPVKIYNASGQLMASENLSPGDKNELLINTGALVPGIYYLQIHLENQHSLKLIKK